MGDKLVVTVRFNPEGTEAELYRKIQEGKRRAGLSTPEYVKAVLSGHFDGLERQYAGGGGYIRGGTKWSQAAGDERGDTAGGTGFSGRVLKSCYQGEGCIMGNDVSFPHSKEKNGLKYCLQNRGGRANIYLLNDKILIERKGGPAMRNNMTSQNKIGKQEIKGTALFICH